ncbi:MAG: response regulator transcription factor [Chloroflexota bacterium]|nr:response regulator transcription factor [Chloroflexota bacterium]
MTRIGIAAPTPMMRAGLRTMLAAPEFDVIGEAGTLAAALAGPAVDVLVIGDERALSDVSGAPDGVRLPAFVVLSESERTAAVLRALPLPGWGIVAPAAPVAELQAAVQAAAQGLIVLPAPLAARLLAGRPLAAERVDLGPEEPLTAREQEVLDLLSQGLANKAIARRLNISEHTVKFHVSAIYGKLGASSRTEAVSRGAHRGLITL